MHTLDKDFECSSKDRQKESEVCTMKNKRFMTKRIAMIILSAAIAMGTPMTILAASTDATESTSENTDGKGPRGEKPSGEKPDGEPPAKPDGDSSSDQMGTPPSGEKPDGKPPAKPDGDSSSDQMGTPPDGEAPSGEMPDGEAPSGDAPSGEMPGGGGFGGADTQSFDYSGTYSGVLVADGEEKSSDSETYEATETDQNTALTENGGTLTIKNDTLKKSGSDDDGDRCNFYGANSISLTVGEGSMTYIEGTELSADSTGSNGIFATDSGTAYVNDTTISTSADNSRGLDATYDGTIVANKMTIDTEGDHCAGVATDRGGGNISVTDSTIDTAGSGSPILYSTGDIEVSGVTGTATGSQIAGMEGLNTILIYDSDLTSEITSATASDPVANGVIIYQSTSGDAETSTGESATFNAVDSTLKTSIEEGAFFYVTNTTGDIVLKNTTLDYDSTKAKLLQIEGNDANNWGSAGQNGGNVVFTAYEETLSGDISVDTISSLDFYLLDGSTYTGAMAITDNSAGSTSESPITVNIAKGSKWVVTADTTISALNAESTAEIVDESGKTVTIVANGETVVQGDSNITLTVTDRYSDTVTTDEHNELSGDFIDRSAFDEYYGTQTAFGTTTTVASTTEEADDVAEETAAEVTSETADTKAPFIIAIAAAGAVAAGLAGFMAHKKK